MSLPKDAAARKACPVFSGFVRYFPDAMVAVAELSRIGNDQHNPGAPLHWDRSKSQDEADALMRHLIDAGTIDTDGVRHSAKVAWRAMALLQKEIEKEKATRETRYDFYVGETVNTKSSPPGEGPGRVIGFNKGGKVLVWWDHWKRAPVRDDAAVWNADELRHGA